MAKCPNCGARISKKTGFCASCGSPAPAAPVKERRAPSRRLFSLLLGAAIPLVLALALLLTGVLCLGAGKLESRGYSSPEEALTAFGKALQKGDLDGMVSTFAIESYVEHLDLDEYLGYNLYCVLPDQVFGSTLPSASPLARSMNVEGRRAQVSQDICEQCLYLLLKDTPFAWNEGPAQLFLTSPPETIMSALSVLGNSGSFSGVEVLGCMRAEALIPGIVSAYYDMLERRAHACGADELLQAALRVRINGAEYYLCFALVRYGDRWFIHSLDRDMSARLNKHDYIPAAIVPIQGTRP